MKRSAYPVDRRRFVAGALAAAAAAALPASGRPAEQAPGSGISTANEICAFVKFLQTLSYDVMAEKLAELGFDGVEATVRDGGCVLPENVEEDLPKLVEALRKNNLKITIMTSSISSLDEPHTKTVLKTAAALGVTKYRIKGWRYDLNRPVLDQLDQLRPVLRDLVSFGGEHGIHPVCQNHSGATNVGAVIWDLHRLLQEYSPEEASIAFDIRHATVEGGLAWPVHFNLMRPHFGAVYVKDFTWDGRRPKNVPLGEGQVDPRFYDMLRASNYRGPISVHVEYLTEEGPEENLAALKRDLAVLREQMAG